MDEWKEGYAEIEIHVFYTVLSMSIYIFLNLHREC
jgi:hypothetical protein